MSGLLVRRVPWCQVALLAFLFLACCFPLMDTDFWWHLRTGELILERGLPDLDWYTFTDFDKPWIDLHWGFQLLIVALWQLGGANLIVLAKAATYTGAVLVAQQSVPATPCDLRGLPALARPPAFRAAFWLLPAIMISGRGYERPEMLSLVFLAGWLWILSRSEQHPKRLWWLIPLQLVWTNCHALSVLGLVTGFCLVADWLIRAIVVGRSSSRWGLSPVPRHVARSETLLIGGLILGTAFVNPWFEEGAFFPAVLYRKFSVDQAFYSQNIGEFQRPVDFWRRHGIGNLYLFAEVWLWGLTALSFAFAWSRRRLSPFRLLMFAGFSHLAWAASRNTSLFALVAGAMLCANAEDLPVAGPSRWTRLGSRLVMLLLATLIGFVVGGIWPRLHGEPRQFGLGERPHWFAHEAMRFAGQKGLPERALLYHNGLAGSYIYHNSPRCRVFMDARLEVGTKATFERYNEISRKIAVGDPSWTYTLRDSQGRLPVLILDSRQSRREISALLMTPAFRLVFADPAAAVFVETIVADQLKLPKVDYAPLVHPPP